MEVSLLNGQNLETLMTSLAEDIIDLKLRYRRKLIWERDYRIVHKIKQTTLISGFLVIAIIFCTLNFYLVFYLMCIAFFRDKINLCDTRVLDFDSIIMLPIFLSIFCSVGLFIIPFYTKPRYLKPVLLCELFLSLLSLLFFIIFQSLYYHSCYYASDFL